MEFSRPEYWSGFSSVQFSCSVISDSVTQWTAAHQASLSITNSWRLLKLMSIELVMPSSHLILCRPHLLPPSIFPSIRVFSNESALYIRWPKYAVSASASVLPMNTQDWSPLGWTGWISLQSKGLSRVFSNTTVQKHQFFGVELSLLSNSLSLLQGIFPTQRPNPGLPHCQLSHKWSPRILEWVADPFSSRSSWPRNPTRVSCIAGGFFTNWAIMEALYYNCLY